MAAGRGRSKEGRDGSSNPDEIRPRDDAGQSPASPFASVRRGLRFDRPPSVPDVRTMKITRVSTAVVEANYD